MWRCAGVLVLALGRARAHERMHADEEPPLNQCLCARTRTWVRSERGRESSALHAWPRAHAGQVRKSSPADVLLLLRAWLALAPLLHGNALERLRAMGAEDDACRKDGPRALEHGRGMKREQRDLVVLHSRYRCAFRSLPRRPCRTSRRSPCSTWRRWERD